MKRIFIDSSVLYSAVYSAKGHSRDLLWMALQGEIILVASHLVLDEVRRNISENAPEVLDLLDYLIELLPLEIVNPSREEVLAAAQWITLKDAPIVAAAKRAQADILVTLDKKHLLGKPEIRQFAGMEIITPQDAFRFLRHKT
jgi:predicted nucleic acid-binding protein